MLLPAFLFLPLNGRASRLHKAPCISETYWQFQVRFDSLMPDLQSWELSCSNSLSLFMNRDAESAMAARKTPVSESSKSFSDTELLAAVAEMQEWALAELYDRYSTVLYTLAFKILGDAAPAQDVLQETFLTAWRKASLYDQKRGNVGAWLIVLCRNLAIDHYRAKMRLASRRVELESAGELLTETSADPASAVLMQEDGRVLRQALAQLPPEQRQVIEMAYFQGMSQTEIAAATNAPLGTVKTRTRQAMFKLRDFLMNAGHRMA